MFPRNARIGATLGLPRNRRTGWWSEHVRRMGAAYLVLVISLVPTLLAYQRVKDNGRERDQ